MARHRLSKLTILITGAAGLIGRVIATSGRFGLTIRQRGTDFLQLTHIAVMS